MMDLKGKKKKNMCFVCLFIWKVFPSGSILPQRTPNLSPQDPLSLPKWSESPDTSCKGNCTRGLDTVVHILLPLKLRN